MIRAVIAKDVELLLRDRGALTSLLVLPLVFIAVFGAMVLEIPAPPGGAPIAAASSFQIAVPANAVLFGFFLALTVATSFAGDRRTGVWRRLLAAQPNDHPGPQYRRDGRDHERLQHR